MQSLFKKAVFLCFTFILLCNFTIAQKNRPIAKQKQATKTPQIIGSYGIVIDERLSVLRAEPSFFSREIQRMRIGRNILITGVKQNEGITFYRVTALPNYYGWVQSDAIVSKSVSGDDERLAKIVQAIDGFDQIELASMFLDTFSKSNLRPAMLLLYGDLIEDQARKLSTDANKKLVRREMAATVAPLHSFYLNYVGLDRFRKLDITFLFNVETKQFHYNGKSWDEIIKKFPLSQEAIEAKNRIQLLKEKLESSVPKK
jgi:hypothetical protein